MRPPEKIEAKHEELRSIVALFRHGDRTPKQKMKIVVMEPEFLEFFKPCKKGEKIQQLKMKSPKRLEVNLKPHNRNS